MDILNQTLRASGDIHLKGKISCQNHFVLLCDATAKSFTVNLPDAKSVRNICIIIVKTDSTVNTVTALCDVAGQKVNGGATSVLSSVGASLMLFPCGADGYWYKGGDSVETIDHALLDNLNSASYTHLTAANATDLTDGGATTLHSHAADHAAATVADTSTVDMSISGQQISAATIGLTDTITFVE